MGSVNSCFCNKESNNVALSDTGAEDRNNNMEDEEPSMESALNLPQSQIEEHPVPHPNFIIQLLLEDVNPPLSSILPSHLRTGDGPSTPIPLRRVTFQPAPHRPITSHPAPHFRPERVSTVLDLRRLRPTNRVPGFNWSPRPSPLASPTYDSLEQGDLTSVQVDLPGVRNLEDDAFDLPWQLNPEDEDVELTHSPVAGDEATPEDTGVGDVAYSMEATPDKSTTRKVSMMIDINELPPEILLKIHQRLNNSALKKAVLVCKWWRDVGQDPGLWECCKVAVYSKEDISNLSIKRLEKIQEIYINPDIWVANDWEAFFRAANEFSSLKKIDGLGCGSGGLDSVDPDLFAKTLTKLEDVKVRRCTYEQIEALFKEMERSTRVKNFHLGSLDLCQMEPGLFARVLSKLENVQLFGSYVTQEQMEAFFSEIVNSKSLKKLDLVKENIWKYLEPGLFARALSTVEDVSLTAYNRVHISSHHLGALFSELSDETQLKKLRLNGIDLSEIEPTLLASALSKMEELCLTRNFLSTVQIRALFTQISQRNQMKKLVWWDMNLKQLDQKLLARVVVRLEDLEIRGSGFNTATFFTEMSRNSHLKSLNISGNLLDVDPEVLAKAVTRLETLILQANHMNKDQLVALFIEMSRNTVIKKIDLYWNDLSRNDLSSVEPDLFVSALMRMEEVRLGGASITHEQAKAFFTELSQNSQRSHLKNLILNGVDFTAVDPEVLAKAVTNVKEVGLYSPYNISTEQISSIFAHVLEGEKKLKKLNMVGNSRAVAGVNPEIVRKVKEKLKYKLVYY